MHYSRDSEWRELVRITGPSHNLLGLDLAADKSGLPPAIQVLPGEASPRLNSLVVLRQAAKGVALANIKFGTEFRIAKLRYVSDDTPSEDVYRILAYEIVKRAAQETVVQQRFAAN